MARHLVGSAMTVPGLVFALAIRHWDAPPESGSARVIAKPDLAAFANEAVAAASNEGINVVEGDLWFFAADGSPLEAVFSEPPYVDAERLTYFAGTYSLRAGRGMTLRRMLSEILSDNPVRGARIAVRIATSNDVAQQHGWPNALAMESDLEQALEAAIPDLAKLIVFEAYPGATPN